MAGLVSTVLQESLLTFSIGCRRGQMRARRVILVAAATYQKRFKNFSPGRHFFFGSQSTCGLGSDRLIHLLLAGYHMSTLPAMHTLRRLDGWRRQFRQ